MDKLLDVIDVLDNKILVKDNDSEYYLDIVFYDYKICVNDKIRISSKLLDSIKNNFSCFGNVNDNFGRVIVDTNMDLELIMIIKDNMKIVLKRLYG